MTVGEALRALHERERLRAYWLPGMAAIGPTARRWRMGECLTWETADGGYCAGMPPWEVTPDLTDHATVGCLLALLREASGDDGLYVYYHQDPVEWRITVGGRWYVSDTEGEAIAAALIALAESA